MANLLTHNCPSAINAKISQVLCILCISIALPFEVFSPLDLSQIGLVLAGILIIFSKLYISISSLFLLFICIFLLLLSGFFCLLQQQQTHLDQILFFLIIITSIFILINSSDQNTYLDIRKFLINLSLPILVVLGGISSINQESLSFWSFGFDDKSHAGFYFGGISLIILSTKTESLKDAFFSFLACVCCALSGSRLAIIFLGASIFLGISASVSASKNFRVIGAVIIIIAAIIGTTFIFWYWEELLGIFTILDRLSPDNTSSSDSTSSHETMALLAMEAKFSNFLTLVFGTSPGGFAYFISPSSINFFALNGIDPKAYNAIQDGFAPVHSVLLSFFVEFPLPIFFLYVFFNLLIAWNLRTKPRLLISFSAFSTASLLYSAHNELYFWVFIIYYATAAKSLRADCKEKSSLSLASVS